MQISTFFVMVDYKSQCLHVYDIILQFVSYKRKHVHKVLVNCLFKLAQENVLLGELTVLPWP